MIPTNPFTVIVDGRIAESDRIVSISLRSRSGEPLPTWSPGDHIDVETPVGTRQYSLCGSIADETWTIAVLNEPGGRGGSAWLHAAAVPGAEVTVSAPRSNFRRPAAERWSFVAGGIGITPLLPMIEQAERDGHEWTLLYSCRDADSHVFGHRFRSDGRASLWTSSSQGRADLDALFDGSEPGTAFVCCGPSTLIDAVIQKAAERGLSDLLAVERFEGLAIDTEGDQPFILEVADTGAEVAVPADRSALEALGEAGYFVPNSCQEGICGSCETVVRAGNVLHRDSLLTEEEREANDCFFPCVSRALGGRLVVEV